VKDPPRIFLPPEYRTAEGVIIPQDVVRSNAIPLPPELRVDPATVIVGEPPSFLSQVYAYATETELGFPEMPVEAAIAIAGELPFRASIRVIARFQRDLWASRVDQQAQLSLAQAWFGVDSEFVRRAERFLRAASNHVVFSEQQMFAVQKLLLVYARDDEKLDLSDDEYKGLLALVVATPGTLLGPQIPHLDSADEGSPTTDAWLRFFVGHGGLIGRGRLKHELARADRLYRVLANTSVAREHPAYCPLDSWLTSDYGLTFAQLQAVGFALYAGSKIGDAEETPAVVDESYFENARPRFDPSRGFAALSADRDWFRERLLRTTTHERSFAFDLTLFLQRPALRDQDGLLPLSPRALESWLGATGAYYRLLDVARVRSDHARAAFATFNGALVEWYARKLVDAAFPERESSPIWLAGRVYGEEPYETARGRAMTPDVVIDLTPDLVLVEVTSGRTTLGTIVQADPTIVWADLEKVLFGKLGQLAQAIRNIRVGIAKIGDIDPAHVDRIWPVLVTDEALLQTPALWDAVRDRLPGELQSVGVQPVVILDLEDFEHLMALIEAGHSLTSILEEKTSAQWRELEFALWYQQKEGTIEPPPTSAIDRWFTDAMNAIGQELFSEDQVKDFELRNTSGILRKLPKRFPGSVAIEDVRLMTESLEAGKESASTVRVAGRVTARRRHGKSVFLDLADRSGQIQLIAEASDPSADLDVGDVAGADGRPTRSRRGEPSVAVTRLTLLAKTRRRLPKASQVVADPELRHRKRYLDLLINDEARKSALLRSQMVAAIRRHLDGWGFLEVETPVLQPRYGGAFAEPFVTHYNYLDEDYYLRVASELYLKRLIVGGLERVYEIGKDFRNEGVSYKHNPEFTMLEWYEAYADYRDTMTRMEALVSGVTEEVLGTTRVAFRGHDVDLGCWERIKLIDALEAKGLWTRDPEELRARLRKRNIDTSQDRTWAQLIDHALTSFVEPSLIRPTILHDYPVELSPFARLTDNDPGIVERFEYFVGGMELGNAFTEINDAEEQAQRFTMQEAEVAAGVVEAEHGDPEYVEALSYGMPPTGGLGLGIDRLALVLSGSDTIRDVILFPALRRRDEGPT